MVAIAARLHGWQPTITKPLPRIPTFLARDEAIRRQRTSPPAWPSAALVSPSTPWHHDFSSTSSSVSVTGDEITYFPLAHWPRSINRQRSLQNGKSSALLVTGFLQIGHFSFSVRAMFPTQSSPLDRNRAPR